MCTWISGYPLRVSYASGAPDYDPYRWAIGRMLKDGEGDLLVWIASISPELVPPADQTPDHRARHAGLEACRATPAVFIPVGTPGVDHAGRLIRVDNVVSLPLKDLGRARPAARRRRAFGHRSGALGRELEPMLIKLTGGKVYDPANKVSGEVRDIYVEDGKIVAAKPNAKPDATYDVKGRVVMAGAIDPHTHIGGGKVTIARMLLPEDHRGDPVTRTELTRAGSGRAVPSTHVTGYRYAEMGYTACFEPAMLPANARQAHMEMGDTPMVDKGAFVMLGNDDYFLRQLAAKKDFKAIKDYVAWTMHAAQAIAVKVVNPGGISAFKFNQRKLDLDEEHVYYRVTPRQIILTLARAVAGARRPASAAHPRLQSRRARQYRDDAGHHRAAEGLRIHLTHIQFHSYGTEGDRKFSSGAARLAELVNKTPNVSIDVGQVMFGQTCTASGDTMRQYAISKSAHPEEVGGHGHRVRRRLRRGAVPLSRQELRQRAAMGDRARDVPAVRRSLAHLPHHRPPERRAVLLLSASDPAAHGQGLPRRHAAEDPSRRAGAEPSC